MSCLRFGPVRTGRGGPGGRGPWRQPLTPPAVSPAMMLRWKNRKNTMVGTQATASAAMNTSSGMPLLRWYRPMLMVCADGSDRTSNGQRKSFHTLTAAKIDTTPMIGREIGSTTRHRGRNGPAPSRAAAASRSADTESKNLFRIKILTPLATDGSQIAQGVFSSDACRNGRLFAVRYCGSTRTVAGIIIAASIANKITLPSIGRSLGSSHVEHDLEHQRAARVHDRVQDQPPETEVVPGGEVVVDLRMAGHQAGR